MQEIWTIKRLIRWASDYLAKKGFHEARLESELLLAFVLQTKRLDLYLNLEKPLLAEELASFKELFKRRLNHEPIAYITGKKAFWTLELLVNKGTLIPRPDTETLIEMSRTLISKKQEHHQQKEKFTILEIGTGSGAIALSLAKEFKEIEVDAIDISTLAIEMAEKNAALNQIKNVNYYCQSYEEFLLAKKQRYDFVVSNPPYIPTAEINDLMAEVSKYEPHQALDGGEDGLDFYRLFAKSLPQVLKPSGFAAFELNSELADCIQKLFDSPLYQSVNIFNDLNHKPRVLTLEFECKDSK